MQPAAHSAKARHLAESCNDAQDLDVGTRATTTFDVEAAYLRLLHCPADAMADRTADCDHTKILGCMRKLGGKRAMTCNISIVGEFSRYDHQPNTVFSSTISSKLINQSMLPSKSHTRPFIHAFQPPVNRTFCHEISHTTVESFLLDEAMAVRGRGVLQLKLHRRQTGLPPHGSEKRFLEVEIASNSKNASSCRASTISNLAELSSDLETIARPEKPNSVAGESVMRENRQKPNVAQHFPMNPVFRLLR